ncbi:methyltransferase [Micromonospora marina]|uniref:methyltransferase n=1 Tax=Micromonospora marina TaxID=307120 RepID=UPI003456B6F7
MEPRTADDFRFMKLAYDVWLARGLWVAAELALPDVIGDDRLTPERIAVPGRLHAGNVGRLLRALAAHGYFTHHPDHTFSNNDASGRLREDAPASMRPLVRAVLGTPHAEGWQHADAPVRTGRSGFETAVGEPVFTWMAARPEVAAEFGGAMSALTEIYQDEILRRHDFGDFAALVDVGGSLGSFARVLLRDRPHAHATLLDLPEVAAAARSHWDAEGVGDRLTAVGGDFFDEVPTGGDLYVLRFILHDWSDDECRRILANVAEAAAPGSRLVVIEHLLPEDSSDHHGWIFDLNMMVMVTGRERTAGEYVELLDGAGFDVVSTTPTPLGPGVVEARRR